MVAPAAGSGAPAAGSSGTPTLTVLLALLVRRARPWQADTGTAPSSGSTSYVRTRAPARRSARTTTRTQMQRGAPTPTTMWLLHTLHDSALQPWHRGLIAARGRSRTNQTARAGAATG
jgi:hypothetical protein